MGTMLTRQRLEALKEWLYDKTCVGREMKAPGKGINDIKYVTPQVYVGYYPARPTRNMQAPSNTMDNASAPAILIMLTPSQAKNMEEERFDRYNNIHRPKEFGGKLNVMLLFSVYEPGTRLPGFDGNDPKGIVDESTTGFYELTDWMDDVQRALVTVKSIPGTDMYVWDNTITYGPYIDGDYLADRRPYFYGTISLTFGYYAAEANTRDDEIDRALNDY